jgi:hypothetical protein
MDDANEDDFWYQTPKGTAGGYGAAANEGGGPGDYQGYINNPNGAGGVRGNSRKGPGAKDYK